MRHIFLLFFLLFALPTQAAEELPLPSETEKHAYSLDNELIYRINFGSADDIRVLLDKGANPNARSEQGDTALTLALVRNDEAGTNMAKYLIQKGADPNLRDSAGNYPIVTAIHYERPDIVALLLNKGADFHIRDNNGLPLINVAKQSGNDVIVKLIQDLLDKENAYASSMRSPERFKEIIKRYSFYSCYYQYWSYYLDSRQDPDKNEETGKKVADSKAALATLLQQIQMYYPSTTTAQLQDVADTSARTVSKQLDEMVSNYNRGLSGVGKDEDANHRCQEISDNTKPTFVPTDLRKIP